MKAEDKELYANRYSERYHEHGYSPLSLGWGRGGRQEYRFRVAMDVGIQAQSSVLDVGCGFADFYKFLKANSWHGRYVGVDIVDVLLGEARKQIEGIDVRNIDILLDPFTEKFDYVISSGVFNARLKNENNYDYIQQMLKRMCELSTVAIASDFLSSYVDYHNEIAFHAEPERILSIAKTISRRVVIRHDYMPYEFAVYIFKNDVIDPQKSLFVNDALSYNLEKKLI